MRCDGTVDKVPMKIRTYSELIRLRTFKERFEYLALDHDVVRDPIGSYRYLNQQFYRTPEWVRLRRQVMIRDNGMDLAIEGRPIFNRPVVHHMNPITPKMIENRDPLVFDQEYLILVDKSTHEAIHLGSWDLVVQDWTPRKPNDTCPWRNQNGRR